MRRMPLAIVALFACASSIAAAAEDPANDRVSLPVGASSVGFSADGARLATGGTDSTIRIWDVAAAKELRSFKAKDGVHAVAFSPDGKQLAFAEYDRVVLLDSESGSEIRSWKAGSKVVWSPNGSLLAFGDKGASGAIHLWNVAAATDKKLTGHVNPITAIAFSPDGAMLASTGNDNTARIWNVASGTGTQKFAGPAGALWMSGVAFSPDGKTVAYGTVVPENKGGGWFGVKGARIEMRDAATGAEVRSIDAYSGSHTISSIAYSPDGKTLASAADDTLKLWDSSAGTLRKEIALKCSALAFSPSGGTLACAGPKEVVLIRLGSS